MKTITIILIVCGIIALAFIILNKPKPVEDDKFISFEMYDKNMNLIKPINSLSIVNGNENVYYLKFKLNVLNTGKRVLTCQPIDISISEATSLGYASPIIIFRPGNNQSIKNIPPSSKITWETSIIESSRIESDNIVTIIGKVRCSYISGAETITLPEKIGSLQIYVKPDEEVAGFDISINLEYKKCGDGICTSLETLSECPQDCVF